MSGYTYKPKTVPCPNGDSRKGKHKWTFVRNTSVTNVTMGANGSTMRVRTAGIYVCDCKKRKYGAVNSSSPGADVRDHLPLETP